MFVPACYKNHKLCNRTVDNYTYAIQFVYGYYKIQEMRYKIVSNKAFMLKYRLGR